MKKQLVLHIGASKCGSSALQSALSHHPTIEGGSAGRVAYAVVTGRGDVVFGEAVKKRAAGEPRRYVSSGEWSQLAELSPAQWRTIGRRLTDIDADTVVLSNEGWRAAGAIIGQQLASEVRREPRAVYYVRPQVDFLNSAWWQWGAWGTAPFERWLQKRLKKVHWWQWFRDFREASQIPCEARVLPPDVVSDFSHVLGLPVEALPSTRSNTGLPAEILRLYQRHRAALRPGPHRSQIDFVLARHLGLASRPPWVLKPEDIRMIVSTCRGGNLRLLEALSPDQAQAMRADPHWWEPEAYADREAEPPEAQAPDPKALDELCARMASIILELDGTGSQGGKPVDPPRRK